MYQQLNITQAKGRIVTSVDRTWLEFSYMGPSDCGNVSLFFPGGFTREQIKEQIGAFRDSLTDQLAEFQEGGE